MVNQELSNDIIGGSKFYRMILVWVDGDDRPILMAGHWSSSNCSGHELSSLHLLMVEAMWGERVRVRPLVLHGRSWEDLVPKAVVLGLEAVD